MVSVPYASSQHMSMASNRGEDAGLNAGLGGPVTPNEGGRGGGMMSGKGKAISFIERAQDTPPDRTE